MKEENAERRRKKRRDRGCTSSSSPPPRRVVGIKEETLSPARPSQTRSCSSGSPPGPAPHPVKRSRSPSKRKNKSSTKRSKSPRNRRETSRSRSRSPPPMVVQVKQERDDYHRAHEDRQHRNRSEQDHRPRRHRDEPYHERNHNHWPEGRDEPYHERNHNHWSEGRDEPYHERNHNHWPDGREQGRERDRDRDGQNLRQQHADREFYNERRRENRHRNELGGNDARQQLEGAGEESQGKDAQSKEHPNFGLSGALLEDTNTFRGVVIKYSEPPESRVPKKRWRLYPFKNDEVLPVMYIHRQSAYLLGRHRKIADIPIDHPSCSKQHAVLQYRLVEFTRTTGQVGRRVRPYIIDLGSGNGTYLNNQRIEPQRYYELKEKDVLKFGFSSREYVVLHESSDTSEVDKNPNADDDEEDEGVEEPENGEEK